jgi:hypothetical protein
MSHTRVKTTYSVEACYGSTETVAIYCHHNHCSDYTTFYWEDGSVVTMVFGEWETGNDLWDAMNRLWYPFKDEWGGELKENVQYWIQTPWEVSK